LNASEFPQGRRLAEKVYVQLSPSRVPKLVGPRPAATGNVVPPRPVLAYPTDRDRNVRLLQMTPSSTVDLAERD
jgi:hypothetical protein